MINRYEHITHRDPLPKTITEGMVAAHPDWTDEQVAERINREYTDPVITVEEVTHWRSLIGDPQ